MLTVVRAAVSLMGTLIAKSCHTQEPSPALASFFCQNEGPAEARPALGGVDPVLSAAIAPSDRRRWVDSGFA
jgi:hypothetical protein